MGLGFIMAGRYSDEVSFLSETLQEKSEILSQLSQQSINLKLALWESEANKTFLKSKSQTTLPTQDSEKFSTHLKTKYEQLKGTVLEKVLLGLIKAYQQYKTYTFSLSVLSKEKEDSLSKYKKITSNLSQEINLKLKMRSLQDYLEEKEKQTNQMKQKLQNIRSETSQLKNNLDFGEVKQSFERIEQIKSEREKILAEQNSISIDIQSIQQRIETEQALGGAKTEDVNKILRSQIKREEKVLTEVVQEIKAKERKLARVKILVGNIKGVKSVSPSKLRNLKKSESMSGPLSLAKSERNGVISMIRSGIDHKNFGKINKAFAGIGDSSQSFTSKIVILNRGKYLIKDSLG